MTALMLLSSFNATARGNRGEIETGLTFGYTHSAYRTLDWATDELIEKNGLGGIYVGLTNDKELIRNTLYMQTGLYYTYLNESKRESLPLLPNKLIGDRSEHYLNIPIRIKYSTILTHWLEVFAYGGPTLSAGLSSKLTYRTRISDDKTAAIEYNYYSGKIKDKNVDEGISTWFNSQLPDTDYRRFDVFLGGAIGARFYQTIQVYIGYDWGLINRNKGSFAEDYKNHRHQFHLGLGFSF